MCARERDGEPVWTGGTQAWVSAAREWARQRRGARGARTWLITTAPSREHDAMMSPWLLGSHATPHTVPFHAKQKAQGSQNCLLPHAYVAVDRAHLGAGGGRLDAAAGARRVLRNHAARCACVRSVCVRALLRRKSRMACVLTDLCGTTGL